MRIGCLAVIALTCATLRSSLAQAQDEAPSDETLVAERATLLAANIPRHLAVESPTAARILASAEGLIGAGLVGYVIATNTPLDAGNTLILAGASTWAVGAVTTLAVPDAFARDAALGGLYLGFGSTVLGIELASRDEVGVGAIALSAGFYLSGALAVTGMLIRARTPYDKLVRNYARVRTPAARAKLSSGDVVAIERDFELATRPIASPVIHLPLVLGTSVALATTAFDRNQEVSPFAPAALLIGLFGMFSVEAFYNYEEDLEEAGLELHVALAPGPGVALYGQF